ncbi:unnamed protein product [Cuscuta campestris]|uniref:GRF-type domain-containing protein n=1 Tax=Cuscuta campestris TaxID=132261 RepID=A0A484MZZ2_9ASTE|nr:unnamed protein product [Cuscuta campestris]
MASSSSTSNYRVKKETRRQYEAISPNLKMARPEIDLRYGTVKCDCLPQSRNCVIRVVTDHEKPNKGRLFYTCDHCGFFLWCHPLKAEFRGEPLPIDSSVMGRTTISVIIYCSGDGDDDDGAVVLGGCGEPTACNYRGCRR